MEGGGGMKSFTLADANGKPYSSHVKGALGGHKGTKVYGLVTCRVAARHVAAGTYQKSRVFFADEAVARAAGYRPCGVCMPRREEALASGAPLIGATG